MSQNLSSAAVVIGALRVKCPHQLIFRCYFVVNIHIKYFFKINFILLVFLVYLFNRFKVRKKAKVRNPYNKKKTPDPGLHVHMGK